MKDKISAMLLAFFLIFTTGLSAIETYVATNEGYIKMDATYNIPKVITSIQVDNYIGTAEEIATQYITDNSLFLFKDSRPNIEILKTVSNPSGTHVAFQQTINNVPVIGSEIVVSLNKRDEITMVINNYKPGITVGIVPSVSVEEAIEIARSSINNQSEVTVLSNESKLKVYIDNAKVPKLVWEISITTQNIEDWYILVNAQDGNILVKEDMIYDFGYGRVFDPDPATYFEDITMPDNDDLDYPELFSAYKFVDLNGLNPPIDGYYTLRGEYVYSDDFYGPFIPITTETSPNFIYNRSQNGFEETNCYYHLDKIIRYVRSLGFDPRWEKNASTENDKDIVFDAMTSKNGAYSPNIQSIVYGVFESEKETGEDQSIIIHETGHAFHDALLIGGLPNMAYTDLRPISEGISDFLSIDYRRQLSLYRCNERSSWYYMPQYPPTVAPADEVNFTMWPDEGVIDPYGFMRIWASSLMDLEYNVATDPSQGYRLGRDIVTTLQLASLSYLTKDNDKYDNVLAIYQADIDIYEGIHLRDLIEVYHNRKLFIDTEKKQLNQVIDFDISENTKWEGYKIITTDISVVNNSTLTIAPNTYVILDGTLLVEEGSNIVFGNGSKIVVDDGKNARIIGDFNLSDNFTFKIRDSATLSFQLSKFNIKPDTYIKVGTGSKIIVENGSELIFQDGSAVVFDVNAGIEVKNKGKLITNDLTSEKVVFFCPTGKWEGITCENGSSLKITGTELHDANYAVSGTGTYQFDINNSTFIRCTNGIELIGMQPGFDYSITDNTLIGTDDGRGISITSSDGEFCRNIVNHFNIGVYFIMSSPAVSKCEITYNKYWGIVVSGQDAIPQLINTEPLHVFGELNNTIMKNGYVSNTDMFKSAQIGINPYASVFMRFNDVISSPNFPGISVAKYLSVYDPPNIVVSAYYNYWGSSDVTDDFFFEDHRDYTIGYVPYLSNPCGTGGINPSLSQSLPAESKILTNAIELEMKDKLTPAIKLYEHIIKKYVNTPEYYVAMARLPYLYEKTGLDNNELIATYDEALGTEEVSHKKFFKGKKVATHIKGKRYDDAIAVAEEMKAEADLEEEIILADINIAIANMLKNTEGKGRSETNSDDLRELISKLNGDTDKYNPSDITETVLPSEHELFQNYPNPFNPVTQIRFAIAKTTDVKLSVYNIRGQKVAELANGIRQAGVHTVDFDGGKFNSGVYYYMLEVEGKSLTQKMILLK
jgi:hypothetical protein